MAEKLAEYRQQLAQVEAAIANDPGNVEWIKLRDDLVEVIELTSEIAETADPAVGLSGTGVVPVKKWAVGERCQAIFEQDGQWYNAKIVALSEDGYFVTYLGFGNTAQVRPRMASGPGCRGQP
jgi:survival-of-motor-neuron-related-splicing factor 30